MAWYSLAELWIMCLFLFSCYTCICICCVTINDIELNWIELNWNTRSHSRLSGFSELIFVFLLFLRCVLWCRCCLSVSLRRAVPSLKIYSTRLSMAMWNLETCCRMPWRTNRGHGIQWFMNLYMNEMPENVKMILHIFIEAGTNTHQWNKGYQVKF